MADAKGTILLVEDQPDIAEAEAMALSLAGYACLMSASRDAALQLMETHGAPDCIVMDWWMPGLEPDEFIARARAKFPATPIGVVSATAASEIVTAHKLAFYLLKPTDLDDLLAHIEAAISNRSAE